MLMESQVLHCLFTFIYYLDAILFNFCITNNNKFMYIKYLVQYAFTFIYFINNNCLRRKSFAPIAVPRAQCY